MEKINISSVKPLLFESHLIISFDGKWIELFKTIPTFDVYIEENKLHLISQESIQK
jgi:hypothetical protein